MRERGAPKKEGHLALTIWPKSPSLRMRSVPESLHLYRETHNYCLSQKVFKETFKEPRLPLLTRGCFIAELLTFSAEILDGYSGA